jgi:hypothetical protein
VRGELKRAGFGPKIIDAQLANLQRAVTGLEWKAAASTWSSYSKRGHYTDADLEAKAGIVASATEALDAPMVLDLGANDGRFSRVVALLRVLSAAPALVPGLVGTIAALESLAVAVEAPYAGARAGGLLGGLVVCVLAWASTRMLGSVLGGPAQSAEETRASVGSE